MHPSFLEFLADPETGEPLELVARERVGGLVLSGELRSSVARYPIVRGIPRFAGWRQGERYADSFGWQWRRWSRVQFESENRGGPMEGHTRRMWERIMGLGTEELGGEVFAEFGCGPGRFLEIVRMRGGRAIGLDLSEAVEAAAENFRGDPGVLICQADALRPPLKRARLDGAFSIGVLHHTPRPEEGLAAMASCVRPGGRLAVSVYGKGGYYGFPLVQLYRRFFRALWPLLGPYPALAYSAFAAHVLSPLSRLPAGGALVKAAFPFARLPDSRWTLLDTFDSLTPSHQSVHESYEVFRWLKDSGLEAIEPSDWGFTSFNAKVPDAGLAR